MKAVITLKWTQADGKFDFEIFVALTNAEIRLAQKIQWLKDADCTNIVADIETEFQFFE